MQLALFRKMLRFVPFYPPKRKEFWNKFKIIQEMCHILPENLAQIDEITEKVPPRCHCVSGGNML